MQLDSDQDLQDSKTPFHLCYVILLVTLILLICLAGPAELAAQQRVSFPGPDIRYPSADGRYELYNVDPDASDEAHALFLRGKVQQRDLKLLSYDRHVDVLWSKTGSRLAVTDFGSSDFSNVFVYSFESGVQVIDLEAELRKRMPSDRDVFENHHRYIEARAWLDSNHLKLMFWGYGDQDPSGFTLWLDYEIGNGFRLIRKSRKP